MGGTVAARRNLSMLCLASAGWAFSFGLGAPLASLRLPWIASWLFVVGACCAALYPLGLALLGERVPASGMARANAWYLACNCAGSLSGPVLIGLAIDALGQRAL